MTRKDKLQQIINDSGMECIANVDRMSEHRYVGCAVDNPTITFVSADTPEMLLNLIDETFFQGPWEFVGWYDLDEEGDEPTQNSITGSLNLVNDDGAAVATKGLNIGGYGWA